MSAVLKRVSNTRSHWIIACDANMDPNEFAGSEWDMDFRVSLERKLQHHRKEVPRTVQRAREEWKFGERQITLWSVNNLKEQSSMWIWSTSSFVGTVKLQKSEN